MSVALAVVAATVLLSILFVLLVVFAGVREPRAGRKQREAGDRVRARESGAQHERSQSRQARIKATHLNGSSPVGADAVSGDVEP